MFVTFYFTLTRADEDLDVAVEYQASRAFGDVDIDLLSVTINGVEIETTEAEDKAIIEACFERVNDDFEDHEADYGDYLHDMRREWED